MIDVTLSDIARDVSGQLLAGTGDAEVHAVTIDTRTIDGGELFVAIKGDNVDGHAYAQTALESGAAGVLIDDKEAALATGADPERLILVDNSVDALGRLARHNLERVRAANPDILVVGVTGSVGKTTTKDLLKDVLSYRGPIIAPPGSFNNEIGMPLTVCRATEDTATLVLEMGADHVGNLEFLTGIAPLDMGIVLRVAHAHVGEFGGIDAVAQAKSELVAGIVPGGQAILNADDDRVAAMARLAENVTTYSVHGNGDVEAGDIVLDDSGHPAFTLTYGQHSAPVRLGLVGAHHVSNALAAASAGLLSGLTVDQVADVLSQQVATSPHRMDVFSSGDVTYIDDAYNANPESMKAGIDALAHIGAGGRTIAVFGAMLELGDESAERHAEIGHYLGSKDVDIAICVNCDDIATSAHESGVQTYEVGDIEAAFDIVATLIAGQGTILFKGSNGSKIHVLADRVKEELCSQS